jgi:predicted RNase H-like HicB family nuclease
MVCTKQEDGSYFATCPQIKGCFTQGDNYEDAVSRLKALAADMLGDKLDDFDRELYAQPLERVYLEFELPV